MNMVEAYLTRHRERLGLARYGLDGELSTVLVLPRFEASRHVVFLVAARGSSRPRLVAKVPRRSADTSGVRHEADMLTRLLSLAPDLVGTVPELVAADVVDGECLVVETFLSGRPMSSWQVQHDVHGSTAAGLDWLAKLPQVGSTREEPGWFSRLLEQPLRRFAALPALADAGERLVADTLDALAPLRHRELPMMFEHGDLSHPNLLQTHGGRLAVLDWERAEPRGLPLHDLCFFLAFIGFARESSYDLATQLRAFTATFVGRDAWAGPMLARQLAVHELPGDVLPLLLLATFARSGASLVGRLWGGMSGDDQLVDVPGGADVRRLVFTDRDVALWQRALAAVA